MFALVLVLAGAPLPIVLLAFGGGPALADGGVPVGEAARADGVPALHAARLEAAGLDGAVRTMIGAAFARAANERAAIDAGAEGDPSADPRDIERARRRVRDELVDTIGIYNYVAGRHAGSAPNRLSVAQVLSDSLAAGAGLLAGDVLFSVDGWRVFDLGDIALLDSAEVPEDGARDADADGREHVLELLRRGKLLKLTIRFSPDRLPLIDESVAPPDWAG